MRRTAVLTLLTLGTLVAPGCKREEAAPVTHAASGVGAAQDAATPAPQRPEPRAQAKEEPLPPGTAARPDAPAGLLDGGSPDAGTLDGADAGSTPDGGSAAQASPGTWTAGVVEKKGTQQGSAQLSNVRAARQEGFDRVVIEFAGDALPGYHLEYVDRPIIRCGSGEPTDVAGQGWLQVRLTGAQAHTEAGQPTVAPRERKQSLGVLRELEQTCDFEGEVTWVLGLQKPNRFRVLELKAPTRLVVDVQQ